MSNEWEEYEAEREADICRARGDYFGPDLSTRRARPKRRINIGFASFDGTDGDEYGGCSWVKLPKGDE